MTANPFARARLFCPGPTPVPSAIATAALHTDMYHRTDTFRQIVQHCRQLLRPFFGSTTDPLLLTSSGTGALEAAMVNLTEAQDPILVLNAGKFGERWEKLGLAYQCQVHVLKSAWGEAPSPDEVVAFLKKTPVKAIFFQANETSTGVQLPVQALASAIRQVSDALICVDAVSGLVAHEMKMQQWGIDAVVAGSQKGFGIPPGLAFIALSDRAWQKLSQRPRFYFDLKKEKEGQDKGETSWTPATTLILSLEKALERLSTIGPEACDAHHKRLALSCRAAAEALGLPMFPRSHPSQALTAISLPPTIDGSLLLKTCRERYGAIFAGGQDHLKGKIIRLAHLGFVDDLDIISAIGALEFGLQATGYKHTLGSGVAAAMRVLAPG